MPPVAETVGVRSRCRGAIESPNVRSSYPTATISNGGEIPRRVQQPCDLERGSEADRRIEQTHRLHKLTAIDVSRLSHEDPIFRVDQLRPNAKRLCRR